MSDVVDRKLTQISVKKGEESFPGLEEPAHLVEVKMNADAVSKDLQISKSLEDRIENLGVTIDVVTSQLVNGVIVSNLQFSVINTNKEVVKEVVPLEEPKALTKAEKKAKLNARKIDEEPVYEDEIPDDDESPISRFEQFDYVPPDDSQDLLPTFKDLDKLLDDEKLAKQQEAEADEAALSMEDTLSKIKKGTLLLHDPESVASGTVRFDIRDLRRCINLSSDINHRDIDNCFYPKEISKQMHKYLDLSQEKRSKPKVLRSEVVRGFYHKHSEVGEMVALWKIPANKVPVGLPKPKHYSRSNFQLWVHSQANALHKLLKRKTQYVTGNDLTKILFYGVEGRSATWYRDVMEKTSIFIGEYKNAEMDKPLVSTMIDFFKDEQLKIISPTRSMFLGPYEITSVEELMTFKYAFGNKNNNVLHRLVAFFNGDDSVDLGLVYKILNKNVIPNLRPPDKQQQALIPPTLVVPAEEEQTLNYQSRNAKFLDYLQNQKPLLSGDWEINYEGAAPSVPKKKGLFDGYIEVELPQLDSIQKQIQTLMPSTIGETAALCTRIATFLYIITKCKQPDVVVALCINMIASCPGLVGSLESVILAAKSRYELVYQGDGDWHKDNFLTDFIATTGISTAFYAMIKDVKMGFLSLIPDLVSSTRKTLILDTGKGISNYIVELFTAVFNRIQRAFESGDITLLFKGSEPTRWASDALGYIEYFAIITAQSDKEVSGSKIKKLRDEKLISVNVTNQLSFTQFLDLTKLHLVEGTSLIKLYSYNIKLVENLKKTHEKLRGFVAYLQASHLAGDIRIVPFSIYYFGAAGVGKTNMAMELMKAVGYVHNYDITSGIYTWMTNVNFQECTQQTWAVLMDDIDTTVAPNAAGIENSAEVVMRLVNNAKYSVEQAQVDKKGLVFTSPAIVSYCSNFYKGLADSKLREPTPFYRRFNLHVEVIVKDEFRISPSDKRLNEEKAQNSNTYDMFWLKLSVFSGDKANPWTPYGDQPLYTYLEFVAIVQDLFKKHMERQRRRVREYETSGGRCSQCGLPTTRDCTHTVKEGTEVVDALSCEGESQHEVDIRRGNVLMQEEGEAITAKAVPQHEEEDESDRPWVTVSRGKRKKNVNLTYQGVNQSRPTDSGWYDDTEADVDEPATVDFAVQAKEFFFKHTQSLRAELALIREAWHEDLSSFLYKIGAYILPLAGVITAAMSIYKVISLVTPEQLEQGREGNTTGQLPSTWHRSEQTAKPGLTKYTHTTWTYDEMCAVIRQSVLPITNIKTGQYMSCAVLSSNFVLCPTHLFNLGEECQFTQNSKEIRFQVTNNNSIKLIGGEISLIRIDSLAHSGGILPFLFHSDDSSIQTFDEVQIIGKDKKYEPSTNSFQTCRGIRTLTVPICTIAGDCGMLYVGKFNNAWRIVAMHYATYGVASNLRSIGSILTRTELVGASATLGCTLQGIVTLENTFTKNPDNLCLGYLSPKSEVWAAQSHFGANVAVYGLMTPPLSNSSFKTKVTKSIFSDHPKIIELERSICGISGYWRPPEFRGQMINEKWTSPWTVTFDTHNEQVFDEDIMWCALADYTNGMDDLICTGYGVLSEDQVIRGIPGSYVNSINMNTSIGPPYNQSKRGFIAYDERGSYMDETQWKLVDKIEEVLALGEIPSVCGLCVLKDEALKPNKMPRVFNCLPFSINFVMKKYGAAWKSFMRANFSFFESAVGINMTSADCNLLINHLRRVDPNLTNLYDGDIKRIDKSWNGPLYEFVAKFIYAASFAIGVAPQYNFLLTQAMKHVKYSIKNDLFSAFWNPSGNDWTVELNSILLSLCERYVYYKSNPFKGDKRILQQYKLNFFQKPFIPFDVNFDFRQNVALITYGDDNLKTMRDPPANDYLVTWKQDLGLIMTDAAKTGSTTLKANDITQVQFLKRNFVFDADLDMYKPPLDEKSLIRMLLIKKDSILTGTDHAATVSTEYLKERMYYGREKYEEALALVVELSETYNFNRNPYLNLQTYDYWFSEMKNNNFQTWSLRTPVETPTVEEENLTYQMNNNSNVAKDVKLTSSQPPANETTTAESISTDVNHFDMAQTVVSEPNNNGVFFQDFPKTDLGKFLQRPVLITTFTLSDSDPHNVISHFDPFDLYLSNPAVINKTNNFTYLRGTMQVIFVLTAPAGCYGLYVASALPGGGEAYTTGVNGTLNYVNLLQVDNCVQLDISTSSSAALQLPWIYPYDYESIDTLTSVEGGVWEIFFSCLSPIRTGIFGGFKQAKISVYANFLDDIQLIIPTYQGKFSSNEALKSVAPNLHAKIKEGQGSKMAGQVAEVAEKMSSIPLIGSVAANVGSLARGAEAVLSWFGFTRDSNEQPPISITNRSVTNVAHVDGTDASDCASLMLNNSLDISTSLVNCPDEDPMSCASLFNRWTLVKKSTWSTTDTGTLFSVPVSPFYYGTTHPDIGLTTAGYFGLPFTYWRGGMEYMIVIPVSKFHRGSLQILWTPGFNTITSDPTNVTFNYIYDVSAAEQKTLGVGYVREKPYLTCTLMSDEYAILPVGATNGILYFKVVNPIVAQDETTVDILVFARAKSDMDFFLPRETYTSLNLDASGISTFKVRSSLNYQGALGDGAVTQGSYELVPSSEVYPGDRLFSGEKIASARALMQKPSQLITLTATNTDFIYPALLPVINALFSVPFTWAGYYKILFLGFACSERYKFFPQSECWIGASRGGGTSLPISTLSPMTCCGPNKGAEVTVPYYQPTKFLISRRDGGLVPSTVIDNTKINIRSPTVDNKIVVYHSFGPDIRVTCFTQVPSIITTSSFSQTNWFV